jgi:hypothetical protein
MFRWKQIVGAVVVPLVVYAYSPLKEHALNHYAIRWYLEQDPNTRSARVRVRNLYSAANMPITVHLGGAGSRIQDFDYADPWDGGEIRYLNSARHAETLRQFSRSLKHPILLDEHLATSTLGDVEDELEVAALEESVPRKHRKKHGIAELLKEMTFPNHLLWLEECRVQNPAAHPCCMERAWEKWEYMLRGIQSEEVAFWRQAAGLQLQFSDFHFTPQGRTNFVLSLPMGHSAALDVHYGFEPVKDAVKVTSTEGDVLMMKEEADLDRPAFEMFFRYWQPEYGYETAIVIGALLTAPLWAPLKYLSTHTLVNRALSKANKLDTAEEWDEVYGRIKFSLKDKFDAYRSALGKPTSDLSSEKIFDYLRGDLSLFYAGGLRRFQNEQQMNIAINGGLRTLASI